MGAKLLKSFIHERLVNRCTPLNNTLHASPLLHIRDNDTYSTTKSKVSRSSTKKPAFDLKKIDAEMRRVLLLAQYRPINLVVSVLPEKLIFTYPNCPSLVCIRS